MERVEIKGLSIEQLVAYINGELKKDEKLGINKLCDREGVKISTIKSRLNRNGYKHNADAREYYKIAGSNTNSNIKNNTKKNINNNTKIDMKKKVKNDSSSTKESVKENSKQDIKGTTKKNTDKILMELIDNMKRLEDRLNTIENNIINNTKGNTKIITKRNTKKTIGYSNIENTRDTTTKSIRLYTEVKEELDKYIKEHKEVKVIDIFSFAILEYINKNK